MSDLFLAELLASTVRGADQPSTQSQVVISNIEAAYDTELKAQLAMYSTSRADTHTARAGCYNTLHSSIWRLRACAIKYTEVK